MLAPLVFAFADRFTVGFYTTTFSLFASGLHGATPPQVGIWISAFMLPFALLSSLLAYWRTESPRPS
jgi:hypothetical protein